MLRLYALVGAMTLSSCHDKREVAAPRPTERVALPAGPVAKQAPLSLARFVEAIESLKQSGDDQSHARVVSILHRLADVLGEVRAPQFRIERIRTLASELEASSARSSAHANLVAYAIDEAVAALAINIPDDDSARASYFDAKSASETINRDAPLLDQTTKCLVAFEAIADTVFVVLDTSRDALPVTTPVIERNPQLFADRARNAAVSATALATSRGWSEAQRLAAEVLDAVASSVAAAPTQEISIQQQAAFVLAIRLEADRLRNADSLSFRRLLWMKQGLSASVKALEAMVAPDALGSLLVHDARAAVDAIDLTGSFEFQRAAVQDAARLVVDCLRVMASTTQPVALR